MKPIAVLALVTGCSWFLREPPAELPRSGPIECSDSRIAESVDIFGAIEGYGLGALGLTAAAEGSADAAVILLGLGVGVGTAYVLAAKHGDDVVDHCRAAQAEMSRRTERAETERVHQQVVQAAALTETAIRAARAGDCATAIAVESAVQWLDAGVYATTFVHDRDIDRCRSAPQPLPPPPPPPPPPELMPVESTP